MTGDNGDKGLDIASELRKHVLHATGMVDFVGPQNEDSKQKEIKSPHSTTHGINADLFTKAIVDIRMSLNRLVLNRLLYITGSSEFLEYPESLQTLMDEHSEDPELKELSTIRQNLERLESGYSDVLQTNDSDLHVVQNGHTNPEVDPAP